MPPKKNALVIVSNRLPVHRVKQRWETSPGGLVSALTPILRRHESTWIGWAGTAGTAPKPFVHDDIHNRPVPLSRAQIDGFYEGFSNRTLWPLYHDAVRPPAYHRRWWRTYVEVNRRFADAAAEVASKGGLVWVHDYHLQLVPAMLRESRPDLRIGFFLHIPFPPMELFAQLPWRGALLEGLLGADVVGFQTRPGAVNFARLCRRFTGAGGTGLELATRGRTTRAAAFPVSIDVERFETLARSDEVEQLVRSYRERLGPERRVLLGVDRLDYTKGIDTRLRAFGELLDAGRLDPRACVLVQIAVPSRERVEYYRELRGRIEGLVGEINGTHGDLATVPVQYFHRSLPPPELVALYRIADVMLVTPVRDGMNLVAKEYAASRVDEDGVLLLSEFTGSALELKSAVIVNPHDIDGLEDAIHGALQLGPAERRRRMRALRRVVRRADVFRWAESFFEALSA